MTLLLAVLGQYFLAQSDQPYSLWPGLFLYGAAFFCFNRALPHSPPETKTGTELPARTAFFFFNLILLLALGFRLYEWDRVPSGLHTDQGLTGLSALRILHEGWRPFFEVYNFQVPEPFLYYLLAGWFALVGSSSFTFHLFFVFLSLASFPFVYWAFRQWGGARLALLTVFLLAVTRWHVTDTRDGYPSVQLPLYAFASLSLWIYFLEKKKRWAWILSAALCGLGLYTYQSFKAFPLLILICGLYEWNRRREFPGDFKKNITVYALVAGIAAAPLLFYMVDQRNPGNREKELFIGRLVTREKSILPVLKNWGQTALMFNRRGDLNARHNIPGRRMLDDATGILFALGIFYAWKRRKERLYFYALSGFFVFSLPCLLSIDSAHSNRMLGVVPFVVFFAASVLDFLWKESGKVLLKPRFLVPILVFFVLFVSSISNFRTYFTEQANNPDCQRSFGLEQNAVGRAVETMEQKEPGRFRFFITPPYFSNHTTAFLSYPARERTMEFNLVNVLQGKFPKDKDAVFFLEVGKAGVFEFLKQLFPNHQETRIKDSQGNTILFQFEAFKESFGDFKGWARGLKGVYINAADWNASPAAARLDPILNFTSKTDFPFTHFPPFRIRWSGFLKAPFKGTYQFQILTTDKADLWLDGRPVALEMPLLLAGGPHALRLDYSKDGGDEMLLHLLWKKPGENRWEVVPAAALGN
jgi:4-amino-4-deoxy-L-arabinose transferase-like glycosyltransferase